MMVRKFKAFIVLFSAMVLNSFFCLSALAQTIDIDGRLNDSTEASDLEWGDNSGLGDSANSVPQGSNLPPAASDDDGSVVLTVTATIQDWRTPSSAGTYDPGEEWNIRSSNNATTAQAAFSNNAYFRIRLDSTTNVCELFDWDAVSVSFWRNGSGADTHFQLAVDADGDGFDVGDLVGTAATPAAGIEGNTTLTFSGAELPANVTSGEVRLYAWGQASISGNIHIYDVSADYSVVGSMTKPTPENAPRPNIVMIVMDDMGYNDIGAQTYPSVNDFYPNSGPTPRPNHNEPDIPDPNEARLLTPSIDTLATDGMRMTSFHTARLCSATRASILTGRYAARMGIGGAFTPTSGTGMGTQEVTLAEQLRELGYRTGMVGKWHLGYNASRTISMQLMPTRSGFHEFYGMPYSNDQADYRLVENESVTRTIEANEADQNGLTWELTEAALDYIERSAANDAPFFLQLNHVMTHTPCWASNQEYQNADGTTWPVFKGSSGVSYYYDVVRESDHSVGRLLQKLDDLAIADDTIVIFTSDNGPWLNQANFGSRVVDNLECSVGCAYPLKDGKLTTWEGGTRVPFLVRWPDQIPAGSVSEALSGVIDLAPTLVGLAGGSMPNDRAIDGIDMWPIWSGEETAVDRSYAVFSRGSPQGVLAGDWKLRSGVLYDLFTDIQEQTNVAGQVANASILAELTDFRDMIEVATASDGIPQGTYTAFEVQMDENDLVVPEGGSATMGLRLSHTPGRDVTVSTAFFSGDPSLAVLGGSSLIFTSTNWDHEQMVTLAAATDEDAANGGATFRISMSGETVVRELFVFEADSDAVSLGDFNGDDVVDCADLDAFYGNFGQPVTAEIRKFDLNDDGQVTLADANLHITTLLVTQPNGAKGTFLGDLNCDGTVDVLSDAFTLVGNLNSSVTSYSQGDIDFNGTVDVLGDAFSLIGSLGLTNQP